VTEVPGVNVAAVYDPDAREAEAATRRFDCEATTSFEALVARDELDAVVLVTPNAVHRSQAEAAFAAGLDVFVEKPIANAVADGRAMVEAAEQAGRVLMVGHNIRFGRAARMAKRMLEAGTLGEIVSAEVHYSADNVQKGTHEGWRFQPGQCPLLPMMQLGIHAVDLMHYLLGPVERVVARTRAVLTAPEIVDHVAGLLTLESGVSATVISNYCTPDLFQVRLAGTKGLLLIDWIPHRLTVLPRGNRTYTPKVHDFSAYDGEDLVAEMHAFAESVRTRAPAETAGRIGLQALTVVEATSESARDREEKVVPDIG
jgi:predicted dehydrogenase